MRTLALAAVALLASASAALAAPQSVSVTLGPKMQAKAVEKYGERDVAELTAQLQKSVTRELTKTGAYDGARIELTLVDAVPNRPTFKQLGDTPGLDIRSFGVGGATITGRAVAADGTITPLQYKWYETDIRQARGNATWTDAGWTIDRFADALGRGKAIASR
jgi:opacity protein-like surface antigen